MKLYVEEPSSDAVAAEVERTGASATVRMAYAETRAAFARCRRERRISGRELRRIVGGLDDDWPRYSIVEVSESLVRRAGGLAEKHALRGYDAVHLAAALELRRAGAEVSFLCFDGRLHRAAAREGLRSISL